MGWGKWWRENGDNCTYRKIKIKNNNENKKSHRPEPSSQTQKPRATENNILENDSKGAELSSNQEPFPAPRAPITCAYLGFTIAMFQ